MKNLLTVAIILCGSFTVVNSAFAQTWTPTGAPTSKWAQITSSADGRKFAAINSGTTDAIWVSTNAGVNWISNNVPGVLTSSHLEPAAWSASGDKLATVAFFGSAVYTSTNYGATWVSNSVPAEPWVRIASSADGIRLVVLGGGITFPGPIYVSADSGQTWTQANAPITNWVSVASSANGSNWIAAVELSPPGGSIYISTNSGLDWTPTQAPNLQWLSVACSADGTKLFAVGAFGPTIQGVIYSSTNSGVSWISNALPNVSWATVACSADGRTLAAVDYTGSIYTSTNSGMTWNPNSVPSQNWVGVALSADGNTFVASGVTSFGSSGGGIYTLQTVPAPKLKFAPLSNSLSLSWLIPSTNFVVQQSSDLISWVNLTNTPTLNFNNLNNELLLSPTNSSSFFRLATP